MKEICINVKSTFDVNCLDYVQGHFLCFLKLDVNRLRMVNNMNILSLFGNFFLLH